MIFLIPSPKSGSLDTTVSMEPPAFANLDSEETNRFTLFDTSGMLLSVDSSEIMFWIFPETSPVEFNVSFNLRTAFTNEFNPLSFKFKLPSVFMDCVNCRNWLFTVDKSMLLSD